jgi:sodium/hydrogen exchanger-like protein 6/7
VIWWAGLRGAIAFALSFEVSGTHKSTIQSTILIICVVSVVVLGGLTPFALEYLEIKTGTSTSTSDNGDDSDDADYLLCPETPVPDDSPERVFFEGGGDIGDLSSSHWFLSFDSKFLKPLFTRAKPKVNCPIELEQSPLRNISTL